MSEANVFVWYGKCYTSSSNLPNIILVKFYILLTIFWTQKIEIKLVMSYERKKNHILKYFKVWGCIVKVNVPSNEKKKNLGYIL